MWDSNGEIFQFKILAKLLNKVDEIYYGVVCYRYTAFLGVIDLLYVYLLYHVLYCV